MGQNNGGSVQNLILLVSLFVLAVVFLANIIVGFWFSIPYNDPTAGPEEIYKNTAGNKTLCNLNNSLIEICVCSVQFVPSKWGFLIHGLIYIGMVATSGFLIGNVFRKGREGKVYCSPAIFSMTVSICTNVTFLFYLAWSCLWYYKLWTGSTLLLFFALISSWTSVVLFSIHLSTYTSDLQHNSPLDLWIYRIIVQNFLALVSEWILCLLLINFSMALVYDAKVEDPLASVILIIMLNFIIAIRTPLEIMLFDKVFRYMLTPYAVLVWTLSSVYDRLTLDKCKEGTVRVYAQVLLVTSVVLLAFRISYTVYRHIHKPLARNQQ